MIALPDVDAMADVDPGGPCPRPGCTGLLVEAKVENCSCHISPPCFACTSAGCSCPVCGFDSTPPRDEPDYEPPAPLIRQDRSHQWTSTYTDNPFNSTPFTRCCGTAAIRVGRCPSCNAEIISHDDGLAARRREVGPGNCLMCGKRHGDPAIAGNCHC